MTTNSIFYILLLSTVGLFKCTIFFGQFPYNESFKNTTTPGLVVSGAASLTAATGLDPAGQGYLRLNENVTNSVGYVYGLDSFPSNYGLTISFEFFCYKAGANSTNQADGMTFFLFDAGVNAFRPGGAGGSLGYAQYYATPGIAKGYIGIGVDEFGNFSSASDGNKNGGPGQQRGSISIRGPGNGKTVTDYVYQTGAITSDAPYNTSFQAFTQRYPDSSSANYRRLKIIMTPGSTLGSNLGYQVTAIIYKGGGTVTPVTLINNFDYPFAAPAQLQFGLSASTGSITNYHEVRNLRIDVANNSSLQASTAADDNGTVTCLNQQAIIDVTANDYSNNSGGYINKNTVDLDPLTPGEQSVYTDAGKGNYAVDANGIVSFIPDNGFAGTSSINYNVNDNYGMAAAAVATINVTVNNTAGLVLTVANPPAVCFPAQVDITNPSYKSAVTPGAAYSYFNSLGNANANINNINVTAANISQQGEYFIRAEYNGCAIVKPISVQISQQPTPASAGTDQSFCASAGSQNSTLLATNPDVGEGAWSMVSGPGPAIITYPNSASSPVSAMQQGVYLFRWTNTSGACAASTDLMQISVGNSLANAGPDQTLAAASEVTLQGNSAAVGTGSWATVSSPAGSMPVINQPSNPASVVQLDKTGNYSFRWTIANGSCTNSDQVSVTLMALLPVQFILFEAKQQGLQIGLKWVTAAEKNNAYFELQRSEDGVQFSVAKTIPGRINDAGEQTYTCIDQAGAIAGDWLYYRLRQVDIDGKFSYSKTIRLPFNSHRQINTWPNPVKDHLNIQLPQAAAGNIEIVIYNYSGHVVKTTVVTVTGSTRLVTINQLQDLPAGVFVVEFQSKEKKYRTTIVKTISDK